MFDAAVAKAYGGKRQIAWKEVLAGEKSFDKTGNWLPDETLDAFREYLVGIKGPLTTPVGGGIRSLNVALRQILDLYVCLRPVRYFTGVPTPVKQPELVDMVIFRENTEDIYAGIEYAGGTAEVQKVLDFLAKEFPKEFGKVRFGTQGEDRRLAEAARSRSARRSASCRSGRHRLQADQLPRHRAARAQRDRLRDQEQAQERDAGAQGQHHEVHRRRLPRLGLPGREGVLRRRGDRRRPVVQDPRRQARRADIVIKDVIADAFLQQILTRPAEYDVVATPNLNGDYISDALAALRRRHRHRPRRQHQLRHRPRHLRSHARHRAEVRRPGQGEPRLA